LYVTLSYIEQFAPASDLCPWKNAPRRSIAFTTLLYLRSYILLYSIICCYADSRIQYNIIYLQYYSRCFVINAREVRFTIDLTLIVVVRSVDESAVGIFIGFVNFFFRFRRWIRFRTVFFSRVWRDRTTITNRLI